MPALPPDDGAGSQARAGSRDASGSTPPRADSPASDVTVRCLARVADGDRAAADELLALVYDELRRVAAGYMRAERADHTLAPTALVHEAWARLVGAAEATAWENRAHFVRVAARAMRRVLVDHARGRRRAKRGGAGERTELDRALDEAAGEIVDAEGAALDVIALDEALGKLTELDPELARLVELRFFAGLSIAEAASALGVSASSVERGWRVARLWLARELDPELATPGDEDRGEAAR